MKNLLALLLKTVLQAPTKFAVAISLLASLALAPSAGATAYVSTGSGAWNTAIWSPVGTPGAGDSAEIAAGHTVSSVASLSVGLLVIDATGVFNIGNSMTAGTITNNGTLKIGLGTSARTLSITTNLVNNALINGDTGQQNQLQFNGGGTSLWLGSGDITAGKIGVGVAVGTTLDISGLTTTVTFRTTGTYSSTISGTLIAGIQTINSANATHTFNLAAGATLVSANVNGIRNGAVGTLNMTGPVNLNAAANYTFNGTSAQITTNLPVTVNNLTVNNIANVTLSAATAISGALTLTSGNLIATSGNLPTVGSAGSVSGSGYVDGPLARTFSATGSKTFLTGKGGTNRPVTLNYSALTGTSTVTVEQFESAMGGTLPTATTQFNARQWTISQTGGSAFAFDLTLNGTGFSPTNTPVVLRQGTPDTSFSTSFSAPNYTATGINAFGNFALGDFTPSPDKLVIITAPQTLVAGVLSGTMTVQLQDSGSAPKNAVANITVALNTSSGGGGLRDTGDTTTIASVLITAGNNSASFKYRDTTAPGTPTITVSGGGLTPGTQVETNTVAAASKLAFTAQPANTLSGNTLANVVVHVQDAFGNNRPDTGTNVTLTLNGGPLASGTTTLATDGTGAATFNNLVINVPATGLNFTATASGLTSATSGNFNVTSKNLVKAGNVTAMDQTTSWVGGVVPAAFDTAVVNNTSVLAAPNNLAEFGASATWYGLTVNSWTSGGGYTVTATSGGTLTLGQGGLVGSGVNHSFFLNCALVLATNETVDWTGIAGGLNLFGAVTNGGNLLTLTGNLNITIANNLTGTGGLLKVGGNTLIVNGTTDYSGATTVSNGTVIVVGALGGSNSVTVAGGTLTGSGSINGAVTVQSGAALKPGNGGIGTLTINSNLILQAGSSVTAEVNQSSLTSDLVTGLSTVNYGGTLVVANLSGTFVGGETFTLFSAASSTGNFSSISGSPGTNLVWNFNPSNGVLSALSAVATNPTNITATVSGSTLTLTWPADHLGWILQSQTNGLSTGLTTNWFDVAGSAANNTNVIHIVPANPTVFFRLRNP